jgi:hypothetical protein
LYAGIDTSDVRILGSIVNTESYFSNCGTSISGSYLLLKFGWAQGNEITVPEKQLKDMQVGDQCKDLITLKNVSWEMGVWYKGHDEILDVKYSILTVSNTLLEVPSLCEKALDMVKKKLVLHSMLPSGTMYVQTVKRIRKWAHSHKLEELLNATQPWPKTPEQVCN